MAENQSRRPQGRGPHGPMAPGEKAKDFKGTVKRLFAMMGRYRTGLIVFALSSVLNLCNRKYRI